MAVGRLHQSAAVKDASGEMRNTQPRILKHLLYGAVLEKITGSQPVKKFPAFYGNQRFITAFTSARHLSLFWAKSIQSMPPIPLPEDST